MRIAIGSLRREVKLAILVVLLAGAGALAIHFGLRETGITLCVMAVAIVFWGCNAPANFYWTGGANLAYGLRDISAAGAFILTQDRWCTGTMLRLLLQEPSPRKDADGDASGQLIFADVRALICETEAKCAIFDVQMTYFCN